MASAAFDPSTLFATEHGVVDWAPDQRLAITLGDRHWLFEREEVEALHKSLQPLAAQVYRCNCDCRWQVRLDGQDTIILSTDQVLQLHSLLDGVVAMLELHTLLDHASIAAASRSKKRKGEHWG